MFSCEGKTWGCEGQVKLDVRRVDSSRRTYPGRGLKGKCRGKGRAERSPRRHSPASYQVWSLEKWRRFCFDEGHTLLWTKDDDLSASKLYLVDVFLWRVCFVTSKCFTSTKVRIVTSVLSTKVPCTYYLLGYNLSSSSIRNIRVYNSFIK